MSYGQFNGFAGQASVGVGGELESPLIPWLGQPNRTKPLDLDIEGKNAHVTYNLPQAFWGKSREMEKIIEFHLVSESDWYTKYLLPWQYSEDHNMRWQRLEYKKSYFEVEPYGGNPNYIESSMSAFEDKMIQRGMAFTIAHGFWKTQMGREQYEMNLRVLENSARLTVYHLIVMAVLKEKNVYRNFELKFKTPVTTITEALKRLKTRFAILNKGMDKWRKFQADLVETMERNDVSPNLLALPPKCKIIMTHDHKSETEFSSAGPLAVQNREQGQRTVDKIRGLNVFETTVFNEQMFGQMYNPLRRIREYGSFFWLTNFFQGANLDKYSNDTRFAAKIMDARKDGEETLVQGGALFKLCSRFNEDGSLAKYHHDLIKPTKLAEMRRRLNDPNSNYVDMWIGYDPARDPQNPYYVMEYLGEQWDCDVTKQQIGHFSRTAANAIKKGMNKEAYEAIYESDSFLEGLTNVSITDINKFYFWAIALSCTIDGAENKGAYDVANGHGMGCIMPPRVGKEGLAIMVNGKWETLVFVKPVGQSLQVMLETDFKALDGDGLTANGVRNEIRGGKATADALFTELSTVKSVISNAAGGDFVMVVTEQYEPMGFGHPAGLRVLSNMYKSNKFRGYSESTLSRAHEQYKTMSKFYDGWSRIFQNHELTEQRACPAYFKSNNIRDDKITAFGLNLYSHVKYPFFAVIPHKTGRSYKFTGEDGVNEDAQAGAVSDAFVNLINQGIAALNAAGEPAAGADARLLLVPKLTDSPTVREALREGKLDKINRAYRQNPYKTTRQYTVGEFLAKLLHGGASDQVGVNAFTGIMEILLRGGSAGSVNWNEEIEKAGDRRISVPGLALPTIPSTRGRVRRAFNTRLCIDPSAFRQLAEGIEDLPGARIAASFADVPIRPMNPFLPTQPLGLYTTGGGLQQVRADIDDEGKRVLSQLKYAHAPAGRNTVSSLTTNPLFDSHTEENASRGINKRTPEIEDMAESSSAVFRRRLIGGATLNLGASDPSESRKRLLSAVPQASNIYDGVSDMVLSGESTVPINIAVDQGYRVFAFEGSHQDFGGAHKSVRIYRSTLVNRFHELAGCSDPVERILGQSWLTSKIRRQTFEAFWDEDCLPLVSFELHRIRQRYYMGSGFIAEGGSKLGNAFHGFHDFQWSDDIIRKVHVGHYTFEVACPIYEPKRIAVIEDVVAMGYIAGEDVSFIITPDEWQTFVTDPDRAPGSILVKMTPYNREKPSSPQDVAGVWNACVTAQLSTDGISGDNPMHGQSIYYYNSIYNLDRLNNGLVIRDQQFFMPVQAVNTVVWRGHHRLCDPATGKWDWVMLDDGPFGQNIYKGCISDRDVIGGPLRDMEFSKVCQVYS